MSESRESRSSHIGKEIALTVAGVGRAPVTEVLRRLDECRDRLRGVTRDEQEEREVARRIAEAKLSLIWKRPDARHLVDALWREIEGLGHGSLEREASMLCFRLKAYAKQDDGSTDKEMHLFRLRQVIEDLRKESDEIARHFERVYHELATR